MEDAKAREQIRENARQALRVLSIGVDAEDGLRVAAVVELAFADDDLEAAGLRAEVERMTRLNDLCAANHRHARVEHCYGCDGHCDGVRTYARCAALSEKEASR